MARRNASRVCISCQKPVNRWAKNYCSPDCFRSAYNAKRQPTAESMRAKCKGRARSGELHHYSKLTSEKVVAIRALLVAGGRTQRSIAKEFSMSENAVSQIKLGGSWKREATR